MQSSFKPKIIVDSPQKLLDAAKREETLDMLRQVMANIEEMKVSRNCLSCLHWDRGNGNCNVWKALVPWDVLPEGCDSYECNLIIPF